MSALTEREKQIVAWLREEPAKGAAGLCVRLQLAWLFFRKPHAMVERTARLIADAIERGEPWRGGE